MKETPDLWQKLNSPEGAKLVYALAKRGGVGDGDQSDEEAEDSENVPGSTRRV
jgi:hypothetical protein